MRVRVDVDAAAAQAVQTEVGHALPRTGRGQQPVRAVPRESRVEREAEPERGRAVRTVAVEREEERQPPDEVRRDRVQQRPALAMCLADELDVAEPEVAQPSVDQLRRRARRRRAEVAAVDERHREPGPRRLVRDPGADDPAADDEQVELPSGERVEALSQRIRPRLGQPAASVTSTRANVAAEGLRQARPRDPAGVVGREHRARVPVAEPARVDRGARASARDERHRARTGCS